MKFKHFRYIVEDYSNTLRRKGVRDDVIKFVDSLPNKDKGKAIAKLMRNPKLDVEELIRDEFRLKDSMDHFDVMDADPTTNRPIAKDTPTGQYYRIIAKWLMDETLILPEDTARVLEVLEYYNKNKNRFKTKYVSKYETFQSLEQEYLDVSGRRSKRQNIRDMKMKGSKKLFDKGGWSMWAITTPEAACYYGKGTRWCTAMDSNHEHAERYLEKGPLYIFENKIDGAKFQADAAFEHVLDENDEDPGFDDNHKILEIAMEAYCDNMDVREAKELQNAFLEALQEFNGFEWDSKTEGYYLKWVQKKTNVPSIAADLAYDFFHYNRYYKPKFVSEFEEIIFKDPRTFVKYSIEYEKEIPPSVLSKLLASNSQDSLVYAVDYAQSVMKRPWPELEKVLVEGNWSKVLAVYVRRVLKNKLPPDSTYIFQSMGLHETIVYAIDGIDKRIPWVEDQLASKSKNILLNKLDVCLSYIRHFKIHIPEFLDYIIEGDYYQTIVKYLGSVPTLDKKTIEKAEDAILKSFHIVDLFKYAIDTRKERWMALEDMYMKLPAQSIFERYMWGYILKFKPVKNFDESILKVYIDTWDKDRIPRYFNEIKKDRASDDELHSWILSKVDIGIDFLQYHDRYSGK